MLPLLLVLFGCEGPAPETDLSGQPGPLGPPAAAAGVEARAVRPAPGGSSRIEVERPDGTVLVIADRGNPDRVALSPDGRFVAFVSGATGLASVYLAPVEPGAVPRQLTNVGLEKLPRSPGQPPAGWVPPPVDHSLAFDGPWLVWNSPRGREQVRWR